MKRFAFIALLAAAGFAHANPNDLGEAERLLAAKSYDKALPIYQRLAEAGDPAAQLRLGEMYWFGDGTAPDLAKAESWFARSAAQGSADAAASLAGLQRRKTHGDEIVYWTSKYQGEDMVSGKFACSPPELPVLSKTKSSIKSTAGKIEEYRACYNGFVDNLNDAMPAGKRIPAEVLDMMTPAEGARAQRHLAEVYQSLAQKAKAEALAFNAREAAWTKATEAYVQNEAAHDEVVSDTILRTQQLGKNRGAMPTIKMEQQALRAMGK